jgi:hypothetical protein
MDTGSSQPVPLPDPQRLSDAEWRRLLAEAGLTEAGGLPPSIVASPNELTGGRASEKPGRETGHGPTTAAEEAHIRWWRPGWTDALRFVGWRWILLAPSALLLLLLWPGLRWLSPVLVILGAKLLLFTGAVAVALAGYVFRRAARARTEPFCMFCGYNLTGLPDHYRCPECGRPYTWRLIAEYRRDPAWFIERYRALRQLPVPDPPFAAGPGGARRRRDGT